jgi:ribonuclease HI
MTIDTQQDKAELRSLEERLWLSETRFDRRFMESVLADDFVEVGASGTRYSRAEIIAATPRPLDVEIPLPEFAVCQLSETVALVTYVSVERQPDRRARRLSVWARADGRWLLRFHQGTPVD